MKFTCERVGECTVSNTYKPPPGKPPENPPKPPENCHAWHERLESSRLPSKMATGGATNL